MIERSGNLYCFDVATINLFSETRDFWTFHMSGSKMQLGDSADPYQTKERMLNVTGTVEAIVAVKLTKINAEF